MSVASVVTMGYLPDGSASLAQVCLFGYGNGAAPPPIPPDPPAEAPTYFGPALTAAQRRRYFEERAEQARKTFEPAEAEPVVIERVAPAKPAPAAPKVFAKAPSPEAAAKVKARVAEQMKAAEALQAKELEEEEKEAMSLLAALMLRMD